MRMYIVNAYRWGDREKHSYTVAVFDDRVLAIKCAKKEADNRGGKYSCAVESCKLNDYNGELFNYTVEIYRAKGHEFTTKQKIKAILALRKEFLAEQPIETELPVAIAPEGIKTQPEQPIIKKPTKITPEPKEAVKTPEIKLEAKNVR